MTQHDAKGEEEVRRLVAAYRRRDTAGRRTLYDWRNPDVVLSDCSRIHRAKELLAGAHPSDWGDVRCLDVGCGSGRWLATLASWGVSQQRLGGTELLADRLEQARELVPLADLRQVSGWTLPFDDGSWDVVSAFTVFSSVLEAEARSALAREMRRVLAPDGAILVYDFRYKKPGNRDTCAVRLSEIRRLFPGCSIRARSLTLAPPIARRVAPVWPALAVILEYAVPLLRSHMMYLIQPTALHS